MISQTDVSDAAAARPRMRGRGCGRGGNRRSGADRRRISCADARKSRRMPDFRRKLYVSDNNHYAAFVIGL